MYFGKNLRYLRKLKVWSQEHVADKLGYKSFTTIQKWESGDSEPPMSKLRTVCLLFNIPMDLILNYDLEKNAYHILGKIQELKYDYNLPSDSLTEQLDISNISYDEWISGESQTYMFYLSELASIFDVSTDFLIGKTKLFRSIEDNESIEISVALGEKSITSSEVEHLRKYRDLDDHGKEMVDFTLLKEWERSTGLKEHKKDNIVSIAPHLTECAASERTDIDVTTEQIENDNDIMKDENY